MNSKSWKHIKKLTFNNKIYNCDKCNLRTISSKLFKKHYFNNHLEFKFKCLECLFFTDKKIHFFRHCNTIKHFSNIKEDDLTDTQFNKLIEHEDKKREHPFICDDLFVEYKCETCNFITPIKTCYTRHMKTIKHLRKNNGNCYKCIKCKYETFSLKNYNKHIECKTHLYKVNQNYRINSKGFCNICKCSYSIKIKHFKSTKHIVNQLKINNTFYDLDKIQMRNDLKLLKSKI